jgi:hypothetical protein
MLHLVRVWGSWVYEAYSDESFHGVQLLVVSILILFLWFQARTHILNRSETENSKPCCFCSYCCSSSYCRQGNLVEASTAPAVRKRRNHGTWASTYASTYFFFSWNCGGCESSLFRIIPGVAGDPCLGINYSGPNPCVAASAIVAASYLSFQHFPSEQYKCLDLAGIHILTLIFRLTPAMLLNLVGFVFFAGFHNCMSLPSTLQAHHRRWSRHNRYMWLQFVGPLRSSQLT